MSKGKVIISPYVIEDVEVVGEKLKKSFYSIHDESEYMENAAKEFAHFLWNNACGGFNRAMEDELFSLRQNNKLPRSAEECQEHIIDYGLCKHCKHRFACWTRPHKNANLRR